MSAGIGWVQAACLYFVREHGADDAPPTTLDIAAYVYRVKPTKGGHIVISDARHVAVKRALANLRRQGLVVSRPAGSGRALRWTTPPDQAV